ncbi:von Willebrand factor D and EGF domain-containing protein [Elysia marginata]|uniref:von Willebrand factor D and EGF domain-containing protein n=1 Tax=Elysia marginata TaxID=1093978 RepID=A0AAV4IJU3_9GAST|nr:von Willebrand factor D and EGF domain-containing protein [Elysia marginata]
MRSVGASFQSSNEARTRPHATIRRSQSVTARWREHCRRLTLLTFILLYLDTVLGSDIASIGCADGTREGLHGLSGAAACYGRWEGHVKNASFLCAPGWRVCTPLDVTVLRNITWSQARAVEGCMAYNAAQDGDRCRECQEDLEQDDMAGIGQGCAHQYKDHTSCISGGRIDASCCVDSHFHRACHFKPGLISGVVCCRLPVQSARIVVKPPRRLRVYPDLIFLLSCRTSGMPPPTIHWYKNGRRLDNGNPRVSILYSGDLLVTLSRASDSGLYTCEASNDYGMDIANSYVNVAEHKSGCAGGARKGSLRHRNVQACPGVWKGHVRNAKSLCGQGWKVCSHRDRKSIRDVSAVELFRLPGCYAYNAASRRNSCRRCKNSKMAGVGKDCGWVNYRHTSCLSRGRIDVFAPNMTSSCDFTPGLTSGVLCCKKVKRRGGHRGRSKCKPRCQHKGKCIGPNRCRCTEGYKGSRCQIAICTPKCGVKGRCVRPNKCRCQPGYTGKTCRQKARSCVAPCVNGGKCHRGICRCPAKFWGKTCQYPLHHMLLTQLNRTDK